MRKSLLLLLPLAMVFTSCTKEPGEGGRSEITGRVMAQNFNNTSAGLPVGDPYPFAEHRVYIIYGDGVYHDDDMRTGFDGRFRFQGLRKGKYRIYTVSQQYRTPAEPSGTLVVEKEIEITEKQETVDVGDLHIERWRGWLNE